MSDGGYDPQSGGIRRSLDGGQSWQSMNVGLDWPFVVSVALGGDTAVYIGSPGGGVYKKGCLARMIVSIAQDHGA